MTYCTRVLSSLVGVLFLKQRMIHLSCQFKENLVNYGVLGLPGEFQGSGSEQLILRRLSYMVVCDIISGNCEVPSKNNSRNGK